MDDAVGIPVNTVGVEAAKVILGTVKNAEVVSHLD